ncbi:hypothetical protein JRI60_11080 [Archangium violaceum]|uniref:hypothetical protein n=1 Tax=Archangium violaceum TaxID=83451 RepID=UPI00194E7DAE|nr:hypothetical protein [Archangium violaceum]QRN99520.1 hypothetical protein JRI60_11080 [Archangium violaceum]
MSARENSASVAVPAQHPTVHEALLERYLYVLQADPHILAAAARPGGEHTVQWAADELRHTAATLRGAALEDAEYELQRVLQEARERLGLVRGR